jgi:Na+-transporting NADH:ubiquinone oxidoreductase subunit A
MPEIIKIKRGLDIKLKGKAKTEVSSLDSSGIYAIRPIDFPGVVAKLMVKEGDSVKCGSPLFYSKNNEQIKFCSPVSGTIQGIVRGDKRKLLEITIESDGLMQKESSIDVSNLSSEFIRAELLQKGYWSAIRQRPFEIIANPADKPKAIFITGFDTAPLAPDYEFVFAQRISEIQKGIDVMAKLTDGKIHFSIHHELNGENSIFKSLKNIEIHTFSGPHPSGNVGTQIHHIDPVNKGETVWHIQLSDLANIGHFFATGEVKYEKMIALCGSEVENPMYFKVVSGVSIAKLAKANPEVFTRFISGNVLSGSQISENGFLGFYDQQFTMIPEGDYFEFFGWMTPGFNKFSLSRTFFSWLTPKKEYVLDTNYHGELRNFVVTGQYEKVFPWDIMPQQLIKSMIIKDFDMMEKLGILEIAEEDFALCEFVCTSKMELQEIVRNSINDYMKEMI